MSSVTAEAERHGPAGGGARRRLITAGVAAVVIGVGAVTVAGLTSGSGSHNALSSKATTTAAMRRTDLAETTPVNGTVGFAAPSTIVQPAGPGPLAVTQAHQAVTQAQQGLSQAQRTLASDAAQLRTDQATLAAAQHKQANDCQGSPATSSGASNTGGSGGSTSCASDSSEVASDQKAVDTDQQKVAADQDRVDTAHLTLQNAETALAGTQSAATAYEQTSKYTALPAVGQVIKPGQPLWSIDGRPVPLLPGTLAPWRAFIAGMSPAPDVAALNQALIDLGYGAGLTASDTFTAATGAAIERLQASQGLAKTGSLPLGSVIFEPTPVRVTAVHPLVGNSVAGGQSVLDVTSTTPVVNVALPVGQTYQVKAGDAVTVNLPDGSTAHGTITGVGMVATNTTPSNSGSSNTSATVNVTVSLADASAAAALDQAPVTVNITNRSARQVLAVPTTALLALAGGGYAVEVVEPNGSHQLVGVTTGIFDDQSGLVEVSGAGLATGQKVVVAA